MSKTCLICGRRLDDPNRAVASADCGGDCRSCMAACGDPDAISALLTPTADAAVALVSALDGTFAPVESVLASLRSQEYPAEVDPKLLADLIDAVRHGGARDGWHGGSAGWWTQTDTVSAPIEPEPDPGCPDCTMTHGSLSEDTDWYHAEGCPRIGTDAQFGPPWSPR